MRNYEITFATKKGGEKHWVIHVEASQANAALIKMRAMWRTDNTLCKMHQFHVQIRKLNDTEEFLYHYFVSKESEG